jgi:hypothetical protein
MQTNYYTLWTLLDNPEVKHIRVPLIQRDYAQGRLDEKATTIRLRLVEALYTTLDQQQPLTLDFVYGELQDGLFVPLDGQQRLTTLFLLHWYLALVDGRLVEAQKALSKFTYETRSSSREFCEKLVVATLDSWTAYPTLSAALRDTTWFQPAWERDPTVTAMLTMLDALANRFGTPQGWLTRLTDAARPLVGFYFLDMPKVGLTDDLYLKMNARGKPLTDFENWKAEFDLLLQRQGWPALQAEFGRQMDGDWTDLFWNYRQQGSALVDETLEQYLHYLTRMLAYRANLSHASLTQNRLKFTWFEQVYAQQANVQFLFRSLDFLTRIERQEPQGVAGLLARLLTEETAPERVRLFGNTRADSWRSCLQESNPSRSLQEQVLLFGLLTYGATVAEDRFVEEEARDLLRVLRNLLERVRQQNDTQLNSNLRVEDLPAFAAAANSLGSALNGGESSPYQRLAADMALPGLGRRGVEHERAKAKLLVAQPTMRALVHELEDQPVFRGDLHNLHLATHLDQAAALTQAVRELWAGPLPQELLIRAWLTLGDGNYAISQEKWTSLGKKYFFGNNTDWYTVLATDQKGEENQTLIALLFAYLTAEGVTPSHKLQHLITTWLAAQTERGWRYYFVKYSEMTEASTSYFAWNSDFSLRLLRGTSLKSKHINPYVRTIIQRQRVANAVLSEGSQWVNDTWASPLWLTNIPGAEQAETYLKLYCEDAGWQLALPAGCTLPIELENEFALAPSAQGQYRLPSTGTQDRIERAEALITALKLQGVTYQAPGSQSADSLP